jgi:BlaI family transcriptional regulator, penicillinase repressor
MKDQLSLSRRERQIMEVIYRRRECSARDVQAGMPDAPTPTAVRTMLRILEHKGHLTHRKDGRQFIYRPTRPRQQAARSAMRRLLSTFFSGSIGEAVAAYMSDPGVDLPPEEVQRLRELIAKASKKGR